MNSLILHPEHIQAMPVLGGTYQSLLEQRSLEVLEAAQDVADPNVSIIIRTRNERERLKSLLADFTAQKFNGALQIITVDSGSRDGTQDVAKAYGAQVEHIEQADFSHPKALNLGFEAADHDLVLMLVDHSNLVSSVALAGITRWSRMSDLGGIYGPAALPDAYSSPSEKFLAAGMRLRRRLAPAGVLEKLENGTMVTHRAVLRKDIWRELGKFDLDYGAGGEDKEMARRMHQAGAKIVREPVLSVYHSHGTNFVGTVKQALEYRRMRSEARPFDASRISYRHRLRLEE